MSITMNYKMIAYLTGQIMKIEAALMCLPFLIALYDREGTYYSYIIPIILLLAIGFPFTLKKPENMDMHAREGFVIVSVVWIIVSLFGALPFYLSGDIPNYINALFETISGFTTTGATVLTDVEALRRSNLFWRSFSHWIGGMGVLLFVLAILPNSDTKSFYILRAEVPGPKVGKLVSKTRFSARILYGIYIFLTIIEIILLFCGGMPLFDSVVNSFSTTGTGGFSILNNSIAGYNSAYFEIVITIFMLLCGINFNLYYFLIIKKFSDFYRNEELRIYLGIITASIAAVTLNILNLYENLGKAFRHASFQVISIITSTGFSTVDYMDWPEFSQCILLLLMFVGACAGSTGGGLKIYRIIILFKIAIKEIGYTLNPRSVVTIKMDGKPVEQTVIKGVCNYSILYFFIIAISLLLISLDNMDISTSVSAAITCVNNIGPGLNSISPSGNFSDFSAFSKLVLSFDMLLGRLEIFPILLLFRKRS